MEAPHGLTSAQTSVLLPMRYRKAANASIEGKERQPKDKSQT